LGNFQEHIILQATLIASLEVPLGFQILLEVLIASLGYFYGAGPSNLNSDASNRLYIDVIPNEFSFLTGNDTPLIYGEFDNDLVRINGTLHITKTAKLTPLITPPACTSTEEGLLY